MATSFVESRARQHDRDTTGEKYETCDVQRSRPVYQSRGAIGILQVPTLCLNRSQCPRLRSLQEAGALVLDEPLSPHPRILLSGILYSGILRSWTAERQIVERCLIQSLGIPQPDSTRAGRCIVRYRA